MLPDGLRTSVKFERQHSKDKKANIVLASVA